MRRLTAIAALFATLVVLPTPATAQPPPWLDGRSRGEDLRVSLVTFGPGQWFDVASWFGHSAVVVEDTRLRQRRLYNYGMFDFGPGFLGKFAMGRLEFWVGDTTNVQGTLDYYAWQNRDVRIAELSLPPAQRADLAKALAVNVLPENREYLYDHYRDNCATRPRDLIDRASGGALMRVGDVPARLTYRGHTLRYGHVLPPMTLLMDFLENDTIDQPIRRWDEAFLPDELERLVIDARVVGPDGRPVPLAPNRRVLFTAEKPPTPYEPPAWGLWCLLIGVTGGAVAFVTGRAWRTRGSRLWRVLLGLETAAIGVLYGIPGTVLLLMGAFSNHQVTWRNENLFFANPLTLLLVPLGLLFAFGVRRAARWLGGVTLALALLGLAGLGAKGLPWFDQDNWRIIALVLPVSLGFALAFVERGLVPAVAASQPKVA